VTTFGLNYHHQNAFNSFRDENVDWLMERQTHPFHYPMCTLCS